MAIPSFHHTTLRTTRKDEMIEWYGLVVGLQPTHDSPVGAWLSNDESNHRIALLAFPGITEDPHKLEHAGIDHTAFEYPSAEQLSDTYFRLKGAGVVPRMCLDHGMTVSLYYADPDGNSVELQIDGFGDWAQSKAFMSSEEFARNPLGHFFDPDRLWSDFRSGKSLEEIRRNIGDYRPDPFPDVPFALPEGV